MVDTTDYSPARMADRAQIQDVLFRWCRSVDRLDYAGMRRAFHPDAKDTHGPYVGGIDGLIEWIRERHVKIPFSFHCLSNILIEFAAADLALVESAAMTVQAQSGSSVQVVIFTRNVDRFERRNGEWRILDRVVVFDSKTSFEPSSPSSPWGPGFVVGQRGPSDYVFTARAQLGLP